MTSIIANILQAFCRKKYQSIFKFYANFYVSNTHYVSIFIYIKKRNVQTLDSLNTNKDRNKKVTAMRKCIEKLISIIFKKIKQKTKFHMELKLCV